MNNQPNPNDILVFVGSTINPTEAKKILPYARYLPPVRCGDILRYLRLKPKVIAIIDGLFERTGAVWHKEIIFALESGVKVYGASSMGALRAAELYPYGMIGVGDVFSAYRNGLYEDDDEVAVLHADSQGEFAPLTDAMVNIRATIAEAIRQKIITPETGESIINRVKSRFYTERTLEDAIAQTKLQDIAVESLEKLEKFIQNGGYVDRKKLDAIALLQKLSYYTKNNTLIPSTKQTKVNRSVFLSAIHKIIACRPLSQDFSWLPMSEKVALESRLLGRKYLLLRSLAELLQVGEAIAAHFEVIPNQIDRDKVYTDKVIGIGTIRETSNYLQANDLDRENMTKFINRLAKIQALARIQKEQKPDKDFDLFFLNNLRVKNQYIGLASEINLSGDRLDKTVIENAKNLDQDLYRIYYAIAKLWQIIDFAADVAEFYPDSKEVALTMNELWYSLGVKGKNNKLNWLKSNNLDWESFTQLMFIVTRIKTLTSRQELYVIGVEMPFSDTVFIHDALRLTKIYPQLKKSIILPNNEDKPTAIQPIPDRNYLLKVWCDQNQENIPEDVNKYAHMLDFSGGEKELLEQLNQRYSKEANTFKLAS